MKLIERLLFFLPRANPDYEDQLHLVDRWLIEFIDDLPFREIGLASDGAIVIAGPTARNYGFWLDTNMRYEDFDGEKISEESFEQYWSSSQPFREGAA